MQRFVFFILLIICKSAYTQRSNTSINFPNKEFTIEIKPTAGIDKSKTTFNFAGNIQGTNPNIHSELIWSNTLAQLYGANITIGYKKFFINGGILASNNISGDVSDKDYNEDFRQGLYEESYHSNHKGNGLIYNIKPGYSIIKNNKNTLTVYSGLEYTQRKNYLLNYKHSSPRDGRKYYQEGINSNYNYRFYNFGFGGMYTHTAKSNLYAILQFETYFSNYYAEAEWNLRTDFEQPLSYTHKGKGIRIRPEIELGYSFSAKIKTGVNYAFDYYNLNDGVDYLYKIREGTSLQKLNNVNMMFHRLTIGVSYKLL